MINLPRTTRRALSVAGICLIAMSGCSTSTSQPDAAPVEHELPGPSGAQPDTPSRSEQASQTRRRQPEPAAVAGHVQARIDAAISRVEEGDHATAIDILSGLVEEPEGGYLAAFNLGVLYDRQGDGENAVRRYVQALQLEPDFSPALVNLSRLYIRAGQISEADAVARRMIDARPDNLDHRAAQLEVTIAQGRFEDAVRGARDILRKDERHVEAMFQMARANFRLERYELGRSILTSALKLAPERADLFYLFGVIEWELENTDGAIANFEKAVDLQPFFPEARNNLAVLLHEAGDFPGAISHLQKAVEDFPEFKEAYVNLGNALKGAAKYGEAEAAFNRAIAIDGGFADAHFNLGILYLESEVPGYEEIERYTKAIESFNAYRTASRDRLSESDPVNAYINEANGAIEQARAREEMLRRQQMLQQQQSEPQDGTDTSEEGGDDA
ncbi:tetratricopeptide repeat protein [Lujinxingia sediminis]|uniref:Tetratricopeptide repeat protein n=1 Tax=Lujinxingia sediminis TaxID=2480984 RepID=A0ABY0CPH5_9DELT|nr:tetratricopeptide repeat protein [Lujinxingia sediminis]RVU42296.1 tetratricopeptide repeat protein [Lujinxingia sediminis]